MTDKSEVSPHVDDTKILLLKEQEENNILKKTLSQKDETIENLKRCLQLYQTSLKENPFNVEAKHNVIECMKEIDDLKETFSNNHGNLITGHNDVQFDDIVIDDVDDLVNFVNTNKDLLGEEHFLKELDASFDVDSEIVKLEDNIDINDLATFPGFSFGGLSEEYSNDDVVSEIMSSPMDNFGVKCVDEGDVKEITNKNGEAFNKYSRPGLPEYKTTTVHNSITGKSMKRMIPREFGIENTTEEVVVNVDDEFADVVDILDSSSEMCGVPALEAPTKQTPGVPALEAPTKQTPKRRIKRQSDIRITDSAKKWLVQNDFQKLFKDDQQPSRKRKIAGSESTTNVYSVRDDQNDGKRQKFNRKRSQSFQSETGGKGTVLYKMYDCSKCGSAFPMDRKDVLNSFYKPGSPRCSDCQTSPKEKEKRAKFNFMSRKKSETSQRNQKMENDGRISQAKTNLFSPQSLHQTEQEITSKKSHIQCDLCGKQFPMGGEWKFKKHMEVHNKGKIAVGVNKPVELIKINEYVKTPVELTKGKKKAMELKMEVKQPVEFIVDRNKAMDDNLNVEKSVALITEGKQAAENNKEIEKPVESIVEQINIKDQVEEERRLKENPEENVCDMCQESFKYKSSLIAHKKAHEGSYPFQCNLCNKFFKVIDGMVRHGVFDHKRRSVGRLLDLLGRGNN